MNSLTRADLEIRLYARIPICALVLIIVGVFQMVAAIGQVSHGSSVNTQSTETPKRNGTPPTASEPRLPSCPPAGLRTLQPSPQTTGHHKVTLAWDASAPSGNSDRKAVGYCLYRNKKQNAAKQNATCSDCEQINSIPLADTGCIDDLVEDGATYYYVVTAINAKGKISSSSNETPAQIPPNKESAKSASVGSYPLCWGTTSSK
jgi:hypothetical protein